MDKVCCTDEYQPPCYDDCWILQRQRELSGKAYGKMHALEDYNGQTLECKQCHKPMIWASYSSNMISFYCPACKNREIVAVI